MYLQQFLVAQSKQGATWMTAQEIAEYFGIHRRSAYHYVRKWAKGIRQQSVQKINLYRVTDFIELLGTHGFHKKWRMLDENGNLKNKYKFE